MAGKAFRKPGLPRKLMALHEHAALGGLIAIAVHGITLLGDRRLHPGPAGIAMPFVMDYRPAYTGLGIIAGYLAAALGLSYYTRRRIGAKLWRKLHRATIAVYVLAVVHTLGAGSDAPTAWLRGAMLISGAPILFLLTLRMLPQRPRGERRTRTGTSAIPGAS
jgi:sulfoxide reductase heme-binding subunit YedZ